MALSASIQTRTGVVSKYAKIQSIQVSAVAWTLACEIFLYATETARRNNCTPLDSRMFEGIEYDKSSNPFDVGYSYIKKQDGFADATDN